MNDGGPPVDLPAELLDAAVELMGRSGRSGRVRVRGVSMLPTLQPGQIVSVEFRADRSRFGDILLFRQAGDLVVHRVVGRMRRRRGTVYARTRGDGLLHLDARVLPDRVVGRVVALYDGTAWRMFDAPAARMYGRAIACHDLFWAAVGVVARNLGAPLRRRVQRLDRWLLGRVHELAFDLVHPPNRDDPPPTG